MSIYTLVIISHNNSSLLIIIIKKRKSHDEACKSLQSWRKCSTSVAFNEMTTWIRYCTVLVCLFWSVIRQINTIWEMQVMDFRTWKREGKPCTKALFTAWQHMAPRLPSLYTAVHMKDLICINGTTPRWLSIMLSLTRVTRSIPLMYTASGLP